MAKYVSIEIRGHFLDAGASFASKPRLRITGEVKSKKYSSMQKIFQPFAA